ncbi:unnamed protein product [Closterium sp. Naga37s-1]|nr:unnamed protein product [Closterium sp. Naga37s-1]
MATALLLESLPSPRLIPLPMHPLFPSESRSPPFFPPSPLFPFAPPPLPAAPLRLGVDQVNANPRLLPRHRLDMQLLDGGATPFLGQLAGERRGGASQEAMKKDRLLIVGPMLSLSPRPPLFPVSPHSPLHRLSLLTRSRGDEEGSAAHRRANAVGTGGAAWKQPRECRPVAYAATHPTLTVRMGGFPLARLTIPHLFSLLFLLLSLFLQIPMVAYAATDPTLTVSTERQFVMRTTHSDAAEMQAIADIIRHHEEDRWLEVVTIYIDNRFGRNGIVALESALQNKGSKARISRAIPLDITWTVADVKEKLLPLVEREESTVVVVHDAGGQDTGRVFIAAMELGLLTAPYAWIATEATWTVVISGDDTLAPVRKAMEGVLGIQAYLPPSPELASFNKLWNSVDPKQYPGAGEKPDIYTLLGYDTIMFVTHALQQQHQQYQCHCFCSPSLPLFPPQPDIYTLLGYDTIMFVTHALQTAVDTGGTSCGEQAALAESVVGHNAISPLLSRIKVRPCKTIGHLMWRGMGVVVAVVGREQALPGSVIGHQSPTM